LLKVKGKGGIKLLVFSPLLQLDFSMLVFQLLQVELQVKFPVLKKVVVARQHPQEKKYQLWKYVTTQQGLGTKLVWGGNVLWKCNL